MIETLSERGRAFVSAQLRFRDPATAEQTAYALAHAGLPVFQPVVDFETSYGGLRLDYARLGLWVNNSQDVAGWTGPDGQWLFACGMVQGLVCGKNVQLVIDSQGRYRGWATALSRSVPFNVYVEADAIEHAMRIANPPWSRVGIYNLSPSEWHLECLPPMNRVAEASGDGCEWWEGENVKVSTVFLQGRTLDTHILEVYAPTATATRRFARQIRRGCGKQRTDS